MPTDALRPLRTLVVLSLLAPPFLACPPSAVAADAGTDSTAAAPDTTRAVATAAPTDTASALPSPPPAASPVGVASRLVDHGFENITVEPRASGTAVGFENRRYRHSVEAFARVESEAGGPVVAYERRYGLVAAAITSEPGPDGPRFHVRYPSDPDYVPAPRGHALARTSHTVDLLVGPLLAYEFGRITEPIQFQVQIEPSLHYNPWPGALATASILFPVYNDFAPSSLHPDTDEIRPGLVTLQQYAWVPKTALASATFGVLADNRYGFSVGAARPFMEGAFLVDAQADLTGFLAFNQSGIDYSSMNQWSSFLGVTYRPPGLDIALRGRIAQFVYGDRGEEFQFTRSLGNVDLSFYIFRSDPYQVEGVRFTVPVPPLTRPTTHPVRVLPVERFPFGYRTDATPVGVNLLGVASREEFLRQLSAPSLNANVERYHRTRGEENSDGEKGPMHWVNFSGTTGFINTPWADVMPDRVVELGFSNIPKKWAYDQRGEQHNEVWAAVVGILPRTELSLRFTRIPGQFGFINDPDNRITTDTDHMASFRLALLTPKPMRPGLAIGADDVEGTLRYHSSYVVTGMPITILSVQNRISLGYAPRVFTAARHVLDGGFGAFEVSPWRVVAARVEYDTEKWNLGIGVDLGFGLQLRAAMLNVESTSIGVGWHRKL